MGTSNSCNSAPEETEIVVELGGGVDVARRAKAHIGRVYRVMLVKVDDLPLGLDVSMVRGRESLPITGIRSPSLAQQWNLEHPEAAMQVGDQIIEVNGIMGDAFVLIAACEAVSVWRMTVTSRYAAAVPPTMVQQQHAAMHRIDESVGCEGEAAFLVEAALPPPSPRGGPEQRPDESEARKSRTIRAMSAALAHPGDAPAGDDSKDGEAEIVTLEFGSAVTQALHSTFIAPSGDAAHWAGDPAASSSAARFVPAEGSAPKGDDLDFGAGVARATPSSWGAPIPDTEFGSAVTQPTVSSWSTPAEPQAALPEGRITPDFGDPATQPSPSNLSVPEEPHAASPMRDAVSDGGGESAAPGTPREAVARQADVDGDGFGAAVEQPLVSSWTGRPPPAAGAGAAPGTEDEDLDFGASVAQPLLSTWTGLSGQRPDALQSSLGEPPPASAHLAAKSGGRFKGAGEATIAETVPSRSSNGSCLGAPVGGRLNSTLSSGTNSSASSMAFGLAVTGPTDFPVNCGASVGGFAGRGLVGETQSVVSTDGVPEERANLNSKVHLRTWVIIEAGRVRTARV